MLCGNFTRIRVPHLKILGNPLELANLLSTHRWADANLSVCWGHCWSLSCRSSLSKKTSQHSQRAWWSLRWLYGIAKDWNSVSFSKSCLSITVIKHLKGGSGRGEDKKVLIFSMHAYLRPRLPCCAAVTFSLKQCGLVWFYTHHVYLLQVSPLPIFSKLARISL